VKVGILDKPACLQVFMTNGNTGALNSVYANFEKGNLGYKQGRIYMLPRKEGFI